MDKGLFLFGDDMKFTYASRGGCAHLGYTMDEMLGMRPFDIKPAFSGPSFRKMLRPLADGLVPEIALRTAHRHKDGRGLPVRVSIHRVANLSCFAAVATPDPDAALLRRAGIIASNAGQAPLSAGIRVLRSSLEEDALALSGISGAEAVRARIIHYCGWIDALPAWAVGAD